MPNLETPDELAEQIADWCGVYGGFTTDEGDAIEEHPDDCKCRMCFTGMVALRIRESVKNERLLEAREK